MQYAKDQRSFRSFVTLFSLESNARFIERPVGKNSIYHYYIRTDVLPANSLSSTHSSTIHHSLVGENFWSVKFLR